MGGITIGHHLLRLYSPTKNVLEISLPEGGTREMGTTWGRRGILGKFELVMAAAIQSLVEIWEGKKICG